MHDFVAAFNRGDLDWILDHIAPDWEYQTVQLFPGMDRVYRGRDGFIRFWENLREPWETITIEIERVVDLGDQVVDLQTFRGKGRKSGVETTQEYANVSTVRGGLVSRMVGYGPDWDAALKAAQANSSVGGQSLPL